MKRLTNLLFVLTLFVVVLASACSSETAPATQIAPADEVAPTVAAVEATPQQPLATVQSFAPACQNAPTCDAPAVRDTAAAERYCVEKAPYENILIDAGVTFEVLEPQYLTCTDNGTVVDGKRVIECRGVEGWASKVKFTNSACSAKTLAVGTGKCQEGLGYDAAQNCCAPLTTGDVGSVIITVNMGICP